MLSATAEIVSAFVFQFFLHLQRIKLSTEAGATAMLVGMGSNPLRLFVHPHSVSSRSESSRCFHRTSCKWQRKLWKWIARGVGGNTRGSNLEHFATISQNFEYRRPDRSRHRTGRMSTAPAAVLCHRVNWIPPFAERFPAVLPIYSLF